MSEKTTVASAIYVDFDNVYITLNEQHSEELSDQLVRYAGAWLRSLEDGEDGGPRRCFLIKRCYMNIDRYAGQMCEGGFDVTLCPSLTRQGKSAVDIQMAMDIIEECLVSSCEVPIEEFIILSNDADFAPVLKKLRRNNRDSTILELGNISSAYRHMADKTITNLPQIIQRLADQEETSSDSEIVSATPGAEGKGMLSQSKSFDDRANQQRWLGEYPQEAVTSRHVAGQLENEHLHLHCIKLVKQAVSSCEDGSMELSELGSFLQKQLPGLSRPGSIQGKWEWGGYPSLKKMLLSFHRELKPLVILSLDLRSIIYDPNAQRGEEARETSTRLLRRVGAPLLSPRLYGQFFSALDWLVCLRPYDRTPGIESLAVRLYAKLRDKGISKEDIRYILETLKKSGYRFQKDKGSVASIARYYATQVLEHCRVTLPSGLSRRDLVQTYHWLTKGSFISPSTEPRQAEAGSSYHPARGMSDHRFLRQPWQLADQGETSPDSEVVSATPGAEGKGRLSQPKPFDDRANQQRWLGERPQETVTSRHAARQLEDERLQCIRLVKQAATGRKDGMVLSELGSLLQERIPGLYRPSSIQGKWGGQPTLTKMLLSFGVKPLLIGPIDETLSIIYDPNAQCEEEAREAGTRLLRRVHVAAPSLSSRLYGQFFSALDWLVCHYDRTSSTGSLVDRLYEELRDKGIDKEDISYILETLTESRFFSREHRGNAAFIARHYASQVLKHCLRVLSSKNLSRQDLLQTHQTDLVQTYHWLTIGSHDH